MKTYAEINEEAERLAPKGEGFTDFVLGYCEGYQNAPSIEWLPISEYHDDNPLVMRWHKIWKCPVCVSYNPGRHNELLNWIEGTKTHAWPEEAFLPFYALIPQPPEQ